MLVNTYLSKENTQCMKGIFAVLVLCHHLYQYSGLLHGTYFGMALQALGYLSVGMFFFFTGYGLALSGQRPGYTDSFLSKRVLPLYGFYVVLIVLYTAYDLLLGGTFSLKSFMQSFLFGGGSVPLGWYLQVTVWMYLVYWFICKLSGKLTVRIAAMAACLAVYSLVSGLVGLPTTWYESVLCMPLGMLWFLCKEPLDGLLRHRGWILPAAGTLFAVCFAASYVTAVFGVLFKMASSLLFAVTVISLAFLLQNTRVINNRVTTLLGNYSLEIYVSQGFMLALRRGARVHIDRVYVFLPVAVVGTALIAIVMKFIRGGVTKVLMQCAAALTRDDT